MKGAALAASRSRESDIGRPRVMRVAIFLGGWRPEGAADQADGKRAGTTMQATAGHPARGRFSVSRQVSWLAGRDCSRSSQCEGISDVKIGSNSLLTVAGAAPESHADARPPTSLLATKSRDPAEP